MNTEFKIECSDVSGEELWEASREAEKNGDFLKALEFHQTIVSAGNGSYVALLRTAWLSYRAGKHEQALLFYERAAESTPDKSWAFYGMKTCLDAMRVTEAKAA